VVKQSWDDQKERRTDLAGSREPSGPDRDVLVKSALFVEALTDHSGKTVRWRLDCAGRSKCLYRELDTHIPRLPRFQSGWDHRALLESSRIFVGARLHGYELMDNVECKRFRPPFETRVETN